MDCPVCKKGGLIKFGNGKRCLCCSAIIEDGYAKIHSVHESFQQAKGFKPKPTLGPAFNDPQHKKMNQSELTLAKYSRMNEIKKNRTYKVGSHYV